MNDQSASALILSAFTLLSGGVIWFRYREDKLFTPSGGLHLQIFIFFCIGGFCYLFFPSTDLRLSADKIRHYTYVVSIPLLIGYAIALAFEYFLERRLASKSRRSNKLTLGNIFRPVEFCIVSLLSSFGFLTQYMLEGLKFGQLDTYLNLLFFPILLIGIASWRNGNVITRIMTALLFMEGLIGSFYSAWRSLLIILIVTIFLGLNTYRKRATLALAAIGFVLLIYIVPFQLLKRQEYFSFQNDPMSVVGESLEIPFRERLNILGKFIASRLNYTRELVYVDIAVERGFGLRAGETYTNIISQLVPRIVWSNKPDIAYWAGFVLPRVIGLVDRPGKTTSWAVNMFAEAAYNYGIWSFMWFVPMAFVFTHVFQRLLSWCCGTVKAITLGNVAGFYLILTTTTVIFMASQVVAIIVIAKVCEIWLFAHFRATPNLAGAKK